jgi:hypothetical protein
MNATLHLKTLSRVLCVAAVLSAAPFARALNYSNTDLLLVFRKDGFNDVEFDLGAVSNYVGLASGTSKTAPYDTSLVASNFNGSLNGVTFLLVAATGLDSNQPRVWLSDVYQSTTPTAMTLSKFSQIRSKISSIGQQASVITSSNASPAIIASGQPGSFTYVASDANLTPASSLGGLTGFPLEALAPGTVEFYEFQISTVSPKPAAPLLGTFTMDAAGTLTFTAGAAPALTAATINGISRSGTTATVSFSTVSGLKYQLRFANGLPGSFTAVGSPIAGDGTPKSVTDNSSDAIRFYEIETTH